MDDAVRELFAEEDSAFIDDELNGGTLDDNTEDELETPASEEPAEEELSAELVNEELELMAAAVDDEAAATDAPEPPPQPAKPTALKAPIPSLSALRRSALTSSDTFSDLLLVVMIRPYESIGVWISGCANDTGLLFLRCWKPE